MALDPQPIRWVLTTTLSTHMFVLATGIPEKVNWNALFVRFVVSRHRMLRVSLARLPLIQDRW